MHMIGYELWAAACVEDDLPAADSILSDPQCTFQENTLVVRFDGFQDEAPVLAMIGKNISDGIKAPVLLESVRARSLASRVTDHFREAVANRAPVGYEAQFEHFDGRTISYRAIALPCSNSGAEADSVLGIMNFRAGSLDSPGLEEGGWPDAVLEGRDTAPEKQSDGTDGNPANQPIDEEEARRIVMSYQEKLDEIMEIDGAVGVALVDAASGMALATSGSPKGLDLEVAAAGNTNVLKAKTSTMESLGLAESIEDILITLDSQIHMIRPATSDSGKGLFIYVALDKKKANLAMARHKLRTIEKGIEI